MKRVVSVSLDEATIAKIERLSTGRFRNKSHVVEEAVRGLEDGA